MYVCTYVKIALAIKHCYNGGDESDKSLAIKSCYNGESDKDNEDDKEDEEEDGGEDDDKDDENEDAIIVFTILFSARSRIRRSFL